MIPTLLVGDYLFVSKTAYGYSKFSFPGGIVPVEGRIWEGAPKRGDVVVFRPPGEPETDFIKRVIGLPGDRVQMRNGILNINGEPVQRQRIEDFVDPDDPLARPVPQYLETLPGGVTHPILEAEGDLGTLDNTPVYVVPPDHYFMMGDNRDRSNDSRMWQPSHMQIDTSTDEGRAALYAAMLDTVIDASKSDWLDKVGFVPKENLIGPAKILFWSYGNSFRWYNPITWATALRFGRLLNVIE
jgi:signal peptidase I